MVIHIIQMVLIVYIGVLITLNGKYEQLKIWDCGGLLKQQDLQLQVV